MKIFTLLSLFSFALGVASFSGSEDKFLKKYAMMKIYESCFGPEVVKQIRREMKAACAKCAAMEAPQTPEIKPPVKDEQPESSVFQLQTSFDAEKLNPAILAFRPNSPPGLFRPYVPPAGLVPYYNPLYSNPAYQNPLIYPSFLHQSSQFGPYGPVPLVGQSFYGNRMSRDMDIKAQLEALTSRLSSRVRNVTCVMQELGYLDQNLEPNFQKILERIESLPVGEELKRDMQDGVSFCQQFSQCVPDLKREKSPLSRELIRPMFFFKCYKHKKLEACIMKDVREKYAGVYDEDFDGDLELKRNGKMLNLPKSQQEIDELAGSMYEFLYGSESDVNIDNVL